ncbi:chemotaxis protein CheA [Desulfonema ishimotonii]|uniref:Chemotaxis protein CheA n=1 Tax=Desulfonema ishimotonii TaxID=45657 RepID=A0A401FUS4_9BACT|nr:chemotaxis protein CheA [Desulfonema ishimotonii]GBC60705.1 chemotaxis protein CheA [Desulfonema ishimotonii]
MSTSEMFRNTYRQEACELLADIEMTLLDVEKEAADTAAFNRIFRAMHTIKGSGAMTGFDDIADFAHRMETVLERVCANTVPVTTELIDLILAASDQIRAMLNRGSDNIPADQETLRRIAAAFDAMLPEEDERPDTDSETSGPENKKADKTYKIGFRPDPGIFACGMNPLLLLDELRDMGLCMVEAHTDDIPVLGDMDAEECYLAWDFTLTTDQDIDAVNGVFMFVEDTSDIRVRSADFPDREIPEEMEAALLHLCGRLLETGYITAEEFRMAVNRESRISELLADAGIVSQEEVGTGPDSGRHPDKKEKAFIPESIRVPLNKIDHLVNLIGELIITEQRLTQIAADIDEVRLHNPLKAAARLTGELRNCILGIRMIPIDTLFGRFRRYVRDTANELGKEIELITEGAETELDKTIIEHLGDPLVHMIRNSIDHGIEGPDEREKAGKPRKGKIRLSAAHQGASVGITIEDDGRGIDPARVRARAVEKGLIDARAELSEKEICNLLFAPGFSTSDVVTGISGRGVGMDVVKHAIDSLRGSVRLTGRKGEGTAIRLSLPLTLAIIDGLLIKSGGYFFILPIDSVEGCIELTKDRIEKACGRSMTRVREKLVPFIRLRDIFGLPGEKPEIEQVVIIRSEDTDVGIVADEVIGEHQTVVKSMGKVYQNAEWISGATIMGDGKVVFILDVPGLIRYVDREERGEWLPADSFRRNFMNS